MEKEIHKKLQKELGLVPVTCYIKGQRMPRLGHALKKNKDDPQEQ